MSDTDPAQAKGVPDRTKNINIKNNQIYKTKNEAIDLKAGSSNCTVQYNLIHDATEGHNGAIHAGHWDSPLIIPNYVIASNKIYNVTGNGGYGILIKSGGVKIYNNIIYNTTQYGITVRDLKATKLIAQVYNNTLYKNSPGGLQFLDNALVDAKTTFRGPMDLVISVTIRFLRMRLVVIFAFVRVLVHLYQHAQVVRKRLVLASMSAFRSLGSLPTSALSSLTSLSPLLLYHPTP